MREPERRLLVVPEQGLGRTPLRHPKRLPLENPERVPVRKQKRRLLRHEDRVQVRAQVQSRNLVLLGFECRRPVRGPSMGSERLPLQWPERMPFPTLLQVPEQRPLKGQALPQRSGE